MPSSRLEKFSKTIFSFAVAISIITGILTVTGYLSRVWWIFELTSHFRVQYLLVQTACLAFFVMFRSWKSAAILSLFFLLNLCSVLPEIVPRETAPVPSQTQKFRIVFININSNNRQQVKILNLIAKTSPDILGIAEFTEFWDEALSSVEERLPYQVKNIFLEKYGIALYSRFPFVNEKTHYFGDTEPPYLEVEFKFGQENVSLILVHLEPPVFKAGFIARNNRLNSLIDARNQLGRNLIIMGDFNLTPWSAYFREFLQKMALKDSRRGFGLQTTWPAMNYRWMQIPIDHCFFRGKLAVIDRKVADPVGSDHLPVVIDLAVIQ